MMTNALPVEDRPGIRVPTPSEMEVIREQERIARSVREGLRIEVRAPYFAYMRVRNSGGRTRDVLLGVQPFVNPSHDLCIVDYRRAPIAEVFFSCAPGDDYEIAIDGRTLSGVLERRHLLTFDRAGELSAIAVPAGALVRAPGGWRFEEGALIPAFSRSADAPLAGEMAGGARDMRALLDAEQLAILQRNPRETLLVLGAAGSGKTTVAIHRIAEIAARDPRFDPAETLVIVPEPGLARLAERMLRELGLPEVRVCTFEAWIREEARHVFSWLPREEGPEAPVAVRKLKRHPALFIAMERLLEEAWREVGARLDRLHAGRGRISESFAGHREGPLEKRLSQVEKEVVAAAKPERQAGLGMAFRAEKRLLEFVREDWLRLIGDSALLRHAVDASSGGLGNTCIAQTTERTRRQLDEPSAIRYAHVRADRLKTLDGLSLDEATPDAVAGTADVEDCALLFELLFRKTGGARTRSGKLSRYRHLVIDEAQALSPVELRVLGRALVEGGSATIAGDAAQHLDDGGHFASWDDVTASLGVKTTPAHLQTSYRCPRPILDLAYDILDDPSLARPKAVREGAPVLRTTAPSEGHAAVFISEALRELSAREPLAAVAILARDPASARAVHDVISRALPARLVLDGDFSFDPGIEVTEIAQVKGLEFDYVIVPDADARGYPDTPEHRRMLHVALTRAVHQAWLISPGVPSPLLWQPQASSTSS